VAKSGGKEREKRNSVLGGEEEYLEQNKTREENRGEKETETPVPSRTRSRNRAGKKRSIRRRRPLKGRTMKERKGKGRQEEKGERGNEDWSPRLLSGQIAGQPLSQDLNKAIGCRNWGGETEGRRDEHLGIRADGNLAVREQIPISLNCGGGGEKRSREEKSRAP